jgi:hypothetical protein
LPAAQDTTCTIAGSLDLDQLLELGAQGGVAAPRHVVAGAGRQFCFWRFVVLGVLGFLDKGLVHFALIPMAAEC